MGEETVVRLRWCGCWDGKRVEGLAVTDEQLRGIMKRYEERLFAGSSGQQAAKEEEPQEEKRWGWSFSGPVFEVKEEDRPKRKLTFREWLDGGMKGEVQWPRKTTTP